MSTLARLLSGGIGFLMVNNLVGWLSSSSNSVQQAAHTVTRVKRRLGVVNRPPAVETPAAQVTAILSN